LNTKIFSYHQNNQMKQVRFQSILFIAITAITLVSCGPSIKTTASWVNKDKMPAEGVKSVFIIALTENMELKNALETDLANAAAVKGIKAVKSMDAIGPVSIKDIAPHRDVFEKKLEELGSETILTIALIDKQSETRYVPGSSVMYSPYGYGRYGGYGGFGGYPMYGGFGGYYGYSAGIMSSPGYYTTDKTYFVECKLFDVKTEELLLSIQSKATNPGNIKTNSKAYTQTLIGEVKRLNIPKK
jgi:hypothetical protein